MAPKDRKPTRHRSLRLPWLLAASIDKVRAWVTNPRWRENRPPSRICPNGHTKRNGPYKRGTAEPALGQ